ncbi:MAG: FliH/SctL family protein [Clostridiales bacterium]
MKLLYNRVFKVNEINFGSPYKIDYEEKVEEKINKNSIELKNDKSSEEENDKENEENSEGILKNAKNNAKDIVSKANNDAKKIINKAKKDSEKIKKEVIDKSKKEGYEEGLLKGYEENKGIIEESEKIKNDIENIYENTVRGMEGEIINLVFNITEKVLGYEMEKNPKYIMKIIEKTLNQTNNLEDLVIKVSEDDYDYIKENEKDLYKEVEGINEINIVKDLNLKKGDCFIETEYGVIENSIKEKIKKIKENFFDIVEKI